MSAALALDARALREAEAVAALKASLAEIDDPELVNDAIEGQTDFLEIITGLVREISDQDELIAGATKRIQEITARRDRFERKRDLLRSLIGQAMTIAGETKMVLPEATLVLAKRQARLEVTDEAAVPAAFFEPVAPRLDRLGLRKALEAGDEIPGARLIPTAPSLTVKTS